MLTQGVTLPHEIVSEGLPLHGSAKHILSLVLNSVALILKLALLLLLLYCLVGRPCWVLATRWRGRTHLDLSSMLVKESRVGPAAPRHKGPTVVTSTSTREMLRERHCLRSGPRFVSPQGTHWKTFSAKEAPKGLREVGR